MDAWLAALSGWAVAIVPLLAAALVALWWLSRAVRRNRGKRTGAEAGEPGSTDGDST